MMSFRGTLLIGAAAAALSFGAVGAASAQGKGGAANAGTAHVGTGMSTGVTAGSSRVSGRAAVGATGFARVNGDVGARQNFSGTRVGGDFQSGRAWRGS